MDQKFEFKENDEFGLETLDTIAQADKFNQWMYQTIKPFCKGNILEIGSGIGNISTFFIKDGYPIFLSDIRENYCTKLNDKFNQHSNFLGAEVLDLTHPDFDYKYQHHLAKYDTVFALNVVEHIKDDVLALRNCYKLLAKNGCAIILVPSYRTLFNQFDTELGHYRRYTKSSLSNVFINSNLKIIHKQYFNFVGILGWFVSGKILRKKTIPKGQMQLYNTFVPIIKIIDKLILNSMGLSTVIVGKKEH
ncbi:class I SAM-dependent methyltransferase [Flavobacteriaceae bacterium SZ-1-7]|uniref:class I SAM-dependent methyltransferase n=1 Tax=Tamlana sedimenti TaxID=3134126 RepID=UPI0031283DFF